MLRNLVLIILLTSAKALPNGAPKSSCESMLPFHGQGTIRGQLDPSPFQVIAFQRQIGKGGRVQLSVGNNQGLKFKGYMIQARANGRPIGTFVDLPNHVKTVDCSAPADTITHSSSSTELANLVVYWQAPLDFTGEIVFKATVAQDYQTFWVGFESAPVHIVEGFISSSPASFVPTRQTTTPHYFSTEKVVQGKDKEDKFYDGCYESKGCFGAPAGCVKTRDCKAVVAYIVKGDRYEFELKGQRDAAYVAVGLSDDKKMGDDSVVECVRERDRARAYMSKTVTSPRLNVERLQKPFVGIELLNSNITDGMIYCRVARDAITNVDGKEYNLINTNYFLLIVAGSSVESNKVGFHDVIYEPSERSTRLSDISEIGAASKLLLRLHGAFMLVAWVGTASIGILLARYFRQTWVGKQMCGKDMWFAWHRFFMVTTWCLTVVGFVLIFVELQQWSRAPNPHAVLGVITTAICFLQPVGAFFRPHPGTPKRPLFNWLHWLGGNVAHILAIVTIFFAVKLTKAELPEWMDWILVAFVAFHVCTHLIFSLCSWIQILGCVSDRQANSRVTSFPMKDMAMADRRSYSHVDRKDDAPNGVVRKSLLGLYLVAVILVVVAMVVVIVLAPVEKTWKDLMKNMMDS